MNWKEKSDIIIKNELNKFLGKNGLIVFFFPKANTKGCTLEAIEYKNYYSKFHDLGYNVIGISNDSVEKHNKFICEYGLNFPLISDVNLDLIKLFEVWVEKSMYGKKYMGVERSTFILDTNLKLINNLRKVHPTKHIKDVLKAIER